MAVSRNWQNLKDFLRKSYNREVNEWFKDIADDFPDNSSARKQAKRACLILPKDSQNMTLIKTLTFRFVVQQSHLKPDIYGIPTTAFHETVRYLPQIVVHWREDKEDAKENNRYPIRAQCSIRYKGNYDAPADITALGKKIKQIFDSGTPHYFIKGRNKYSYRDKEKGYEMIITAQNRTDAKEVINLMLEIQGDNPLNEEFLTESTVEKNWNTINKVKVGGNYHNKPKQRPIGKVIFTHAELKVHGMTRDMVLHTNMKPITPTSLI